VRVPVASVAVLPTSLTLTSGDTDMLIVTVLPVNATNPSVTYTSSNTAVATVNAVGLVRAVGTGTATITVASVEDPTKTATCTITVPQPIIYVNGVTLNQASLTLAAGTTGTLTATVTPANAANRSVDWFTSSAFVATVANGVVSALSAGTATITVRTVDGGFEDYCTVVVTPPHVPVTGVSASPTSMNLVAGNSDLLSAIIQPFNATNQNVTFTSSNNAVATVNTSGLVTAVASGDATITIVTAEGAFSADCRVVVTRAPVHVTGVTLTPTTAEIIRGNTRQLTATVIPASADNRNVTFTSSNSAVATVNATGLVSAVAVGRAVITVETVEGGFKASSDITVSPDIINPTGVTVSPTSATVAIGDKQQLTETVEPNNATDKSVTWITSNAAVATVSNTGEVTAVSDGTARITVRTNVGGHEAFSDITVPEMKVAVSADYPGNIDDVANAGDISANNLELIGNKVHLKKSIAEAIAKRLLSCDAVDTYILPVFTAAVAPVGQVAEVVFDVKGKDLLASVLEDIRLIGMIPGNDGEELVYTSSGFGDGLFTLTLNGVPVAAGEAINPNADYKLIVYIKDGGKFDLDTVANGKVLTSIYFAAEKAARKGGGGGCNAYGYLAFALLAAVPFVLRRK